MKNESNMGSVASIVWGTLFGAIGVGYFLYGKRQSMIMPLVCGIALMAYPWFVPGALWIVMIGIVLAALPFFLRF